MYTEEFVHAIAAKYEKKVTEKDLPRAAELFVTRLRKGIDYFYFFGPYWWAVKDLVQKHTTGDDWFYGDYCDGLTKERAWHKTEYRTICAAEHFYFECLIPTDHHFVLINGIEASYTLFDVDSGIEGTLAYNVNE